jgi:hypothetical protein
MSQPCSRLQDATHSTARPHRSSRRPRHLELLLCAAYLYASLPRIPHATQLSIDLRSQRVKQVGPALWTERCAMLGLIVRALRVIHRRHLHRVKRFDLISFAHTFDHSDFISSVAALRDVRCGKCPASESIDGMRDCSRCDLVVVSLVQGLLVLVWIPFMLWFEAFLRHCLLLLLL